MADREDLDLYFGDPRERQKAALPVAGRFDNCPACGWELGGHPSLSCPACGVRLDDGARPCLPGNAPFPAPVGEHAVTSRTARHVGELVREPEPSPRMLEAEE